VNIDVKKDNRIPSELLDILPKKTGVYIFRDNKGKIIYIGKAKNIYSRVRSYFSKRSKDFLYMKPHGFISQIKDIDYIITSNEVEALILEGNLIKKNRPKYNVELKDDKSYPFIAITDEEFPRVFLTRNRNMRSAKYYGPYTDAGAARKTIDFLRAVYRIRDCRKQKPGKSSRPPCLNYHIGLCSAPCIGNIKEAEYRKNIELIRSFLKGSDRRMVSDLERKMGALSAGLKFEEASGIKRIIENIKKIHQDQRIIFDSSDTWDFIAINRQDKTVALSIFTYRYGALALVNNFILQDIAHLSDNEVMSGFITRYYEDMNNLPSRIFVNLLPGDNTVLEDWFKKEKQRSVRILVPRAGEKKKILDMAVKNAVLYLEKKKFESSTGHSQAYVDLVRLGRILGLDNIPRRIECYDISNLGESFPVGSMAVACDGELRPSHYRHFRIKTVTGQDDCSMLAEVVRRRLKYLSSDEPVKNESFYFRPDLLVIDGGIAQFNAVKKVMEETGSSNIDLISIAKKEEAVFSSRSREGMKFDMNSEALRVIIRLRDEAHRFALGYHRDLRGKYMTHSILDEIKGIGEKKKEYILESVESINDLRDMEIEEITNIRGINYRDAVNIYNSLHR